MDISRPGGWLFLCIKKPITGEMAWVIEIPISRGNSRYHILSPLFNYCYNLITNDLAHSKWNQGRIGETKRSVYMMKKQFTTIKPIKTYMLQGKMYEEARDRTLEVTFLHDNHLFAKEIDKDTTTIYKISKEKSKQVLQLQYHVEVTDENVISALKQILETYPIN